MAQCRLWANVRMGSDSSHLLLSCTPPLVLSAPGRTSSQVQGRTCRADAHKLICLEIYSHKVFYGTSPRVDCEANEPPHTSSFIVPGSAWACPRLGEASHAASIRAQSSGAS